MSKPPKPQLKHIAVLLQGYLEREGISVVELGRQLGIPTKKAPVASGWARGLFAPSVQYRAKLAALLKVDETELMPRGNGRVAEADVRALEAHLQAPPQPAQVMPPRKTHDVLGYSVASDGQAELRMVARGPHTRMAAIFRMLLDAGLVPGGEEEDTV